MVRNDYTRCMTWSHDGTRIALQLGKGRAEIWDVVTERLVSTLDKKTDVWMGPMVWSRDGTQLLTAGHFGKIDLWDVATGRRISELGYFFPHNDGQRIWICLSSLHDGTWLGLESEYRSWSWNYGIWNLATRCRVSKFEDYAFLSKKIWSHDGTRLSVKANLRGLEILDVETGQRILMLEDSKDFDTLTWSHDGKRLLARRGSGIYKIWDTTTGRCELTFKHPNLRPHLRVVDWL